MRLLSLGVLLTGLLAVAWTAATWRDNSESATVPIVTSFGNLKDIGARPSDSKAGDIRIAQLDNELKELRAELGRLRASLHAQHAGSPPTSSVPSPIHREDPEADVAHTEERFARIDARLGGEVADPNWAPSATATIERAVLQIEGSTLQQVECGSTVCRAVVEHAKDVDLAEFELRFLDGVARTLPRSAMQHASGDAGRSQSTIYLARTGHRLASATTRGDS